MIDTDGSAIGTSSPLFARQSISSRLPFTAHDEMNWSMMPHGMRGKVCSADWHSSARSSGESATHRICSRNTDTATSSDAELLSPLPMGTSAAIAMSKPTSFLPKRVMNS